MHVPCFLTKLFEIAMRAEPVPLAIDPSGHTPTLDRLDVLR